jgi:hypothetical protein
MEQNSCEGILDFGGLMDMALCVCVCVFVLKGANNLCRKPKLVY